MCEREQSVCERYLVCSQQQPQKVTRSTASKTPTTTAATTMVRVSLSRPSSSSSEAGTGNTWESTIDPSLLRVLQSLLPQL